MTGTVLRAARREVVDEGSGIHWEKATALGHGTIYRGEGEGM